MFFYLAKTFWSFAQPVSLIGILLAASLVASLLSWRRLSFGAGLVAFLILVVFGWTTAGALMLKPLEQRFSRPAAPPAHVDGIVVLGGAFEGGVNSVRGGFELNEAGDRMTEAAMLALRYPQARLLISGGSGVIRRERAGDGETGPGFFQALGISADRIIIDNKSRNTDENAQLSKELSGVKPGETWMLVTSAFHMPRSVGLFRKAGFEVVPWPADYRTGGNETFGLCRENSLTCLRHASVAMREWVGLLAYWLTGKIDQPFPGP